MRRSSRGLAVSAALALVGALLAPGLAVAASPNTASPTGSATIAFASNTIPLGVARLVQHGTDVTVLAWSFALTRVVAIAERLAERGFSAEIIDPRWLDRATFDRQTVLESVGRTGALVIVEDAMHSFSMGSQILDYLLPDLFVQLRTSPLRVTGEDVYASVSAPLETHALLRDEPIENALVAAATAARRNQK